MPSLSLDAGEIEATLPRGEVVLVSPFAEAPSDVLLALPPDPRAARQARRALAEARIPEELEHTVGLLVTELIANSLRHAGLEEDQRIMVAARFVADLVRVEVHDPGAGFDPDTGLSGRGYGLRMVDKLASRLGVDVHEFTRELFDVHRGILGLNRFRD